MAREVNQVWNHINEVSAKAARPFHGKSKYLSGYDLQKCTAGYSKCDDVSVGSGTVHPQVQPVVALHDELSRAQQPGLPLA